MNKPDKTIDTFELYQKYNIEDLIYMLICKMKADELVRQNNIKYAS